LLVPQGGAMAQNQREFAPAAAIEAPTFSALGAGIWQG
jgi:hypothetical protein